MKKHHTFLTWLAMSAVSTYFITGIANAGGLNPNLSATNLSTANLAQSRQADGIIIQYADQELQSSLQSGIQSIAASNALSQLSASAGVQLIHKQVIATGAIVVDVADKSQNLAALVQKLQANPAVEYAEPNAIMHAMLTPNDTRYNEQWNYFENTGGIRADLAWDKATGSGAVVAVIDTGRTPHSELDGNTITGYDFISDTTISRDGNGRDSNPNDEGDWFNAGECGRPTGSNSSWHGTHVAGTIAAITNNNAGVAGVAHNAKIFHARVLGKCGGTLADIADAMIWSAGGNVPGVPNNQNPADVINMSLGGGGACSNTYQTAINQARNLGTTVVVAAGNSSANASSFQPANCNGVVTIASTTRQGARSSFSNFGSVVDLAGPGSSILSTLNSGTQTQGSQSYASYSGTSMATPHVAGVAALLYQAKTNITPDEVETALKNTARAFPGSCSQCGSGIVDANAAVDEVSNGPSNNPPDANFTFSVNGLSVNFTDTSTDSDGNINSWSWNFGDNGTSSSQSPSHTYSSAGTYTVQLTVTDDDSASDSISKSVTVSSGPGGNELQNGVPKTGLSGSQGDQLRFTLVVPADANTLSFNISGGTGDADMYIRFANEPTTSSYDCRPYLNGNSETCNISNIQAGTYHVMLRGYRAFSGVSLVGTYSTEADPSELQNGIPKTGLSASQGNELRYTLQVPNGASNLSFNISGGSGDADLYIRFGNAPTTSTYDCRPYLNGNSETCNISNIQAGTYHVMVRAYRTFSGVSLTGSYNN